MRARAALVAAATALVALVAGTLSPSAAETVASWTDAEFTNSSLGTIRCGDNGTFLGTASAAFLSGNAFRGDVDSSAANRLTVSAGSTTTVSPASATAAGTGYRQNVGISALNSDAALALPASVALPTGTPVPAGWVSAGGTGRAGAASGVLGATGAPDVSAAAAAGSSWLAVHLDEIVGRATGSLLSVLQPGITSTDLLVGGVTSSATLDACAALFGAAQADVLTRDYSVSQLSIVTGSPLVTSLTTSVGSARSSLVSTVAGLGSNASVLADINSQIGSSLNGLLGILSLGSVSTTLSATVNQQDLAALDTLLGGTASGGGGLVTVDFAKGTVRTDLGKLHTLSGRPANTPLQYSPAQTAAVTGALVEALTTWTAAVTTALAKAVSSVTITSKTDIELRAVLVTVPIAVATVSATVTAAPLGPLKAGTAVASVTSTVLPAAGLLTGVVSGLVSGLLTSLTSTTTGVGRIVGATVQPVLDATFSGLATSLPQTSATLQLGVDNLLKFLFAPDGVLELSLNAQNAPRSDGSPAPAELASLPAGRYDIAALRIGVRNRPGVLLSFTGRSALIARSAVGPAAPLR